MGQLSEWVAVVSPLPSEILGRPVLIDSAVSAIGSANLLMAFSTPMIYKVLTAPLRFQRSDDFAFNRDMATFGAVARMDGDLPDATATGGAVLHTD